MRNFFIELFFIKKLSLLQIANEWLDYKVVSKWLTFCGQFIYTVII